LGCSIIVLANHTVSLAEPGSTSEAAIIITAVRTSAFGVFIVAVVLRDVG
jgi:hypothetical protein